MGWKLVEVVAVVVDDGADGGGRGGGSNKPSRLDTAPTDDCGGCGSELLSSS